MSSNSSETEVQKWFPCLYRSKKGTKCEGKPKLRIFCFPPSGCSEDLYSTEGTGVRQAKSPLIEWALSHQSELWSVQYPGRGQRRNEDFAKSIPEIANPLSSIFRRNCNDGVPYVVIAHSVGAWIAYEFLELLRQNAMKMPEHVFFSCFPPPTIPPNERPWRKNNELNEEEFKDECRKWNVNDIVFGIIWGTYQPLLRADFTLFDQYEYNHGEGAEGSKDGKPGKKFNWPLTVFYGKNDQMITQSMCQSWKEWSSGEFELISNEGHHLFPLVKEKKLIWLNDIVKRLDGVMDLYELRLEYEGMGL